MTQSSKNKILKQKNKPSKVKVTCVECPNCKDLIYSRAHYDFHYCSCKSTHVDGGFDYVKYGWNPKFPQPKLVNKFITGVTKSDLYNDWNNRINKYGIIKN